MDRPGLVDRLHLEGWLVDTSIECAAVLRIAVGIVGDEEGSVSLLGEVSANVPIGAANVRGAPSDCHLIDGEELPLALH